MKVSELHPGMQLKDPIMGQVNTFIAQCSHPYYHGLQLVIWRLGNGELSFDALSAQQVLFGDPIPGNLETWKQNVKEAMLL